MDLTVVLPWVRAFTLSAVVGLQGIQRLWGLRGLRALILGLASPIVLPSMVRRHLVRLSLSSPANAAGIIQAESEGHADSFTLSRRRVLITYS
jgi:hypothetical protein